VRHPGTAAVLNALASGIGQFYNGPPPVSQDRADHR
jgi:hypothetical protein